LDPAVELFGITVKKASKNMFKHMFLFFSIMLFGLIVEPKSPIRTEAVAIPGRGS
jgi:hypothetical protein